MTKNDVVMNHDDKLIACMDAYIAIDKDVNTTEEFGGLLYDATMNIHLIASVFAGNRKYINEIRAAKLRAANIIKKLPYGKEVLEEEIKMMKR